MTSTTDSARNLPVRAVFFDVDDTFYDHRNNQIPHGYIDAVKALSKAGVKTALCTGRSLRLIENLMPQTMELWDGIVAGNGAYVWDENRSLLFSRPLPDETVDALQKLCAAHGAGIFASGSDAFIFDDLPSVQAKLDSLHVHGLECRKPTDKDSFSVLSLCHENPQVLLDSLKNIQDVFIQPTAFSIDISREDLSKFEGISHLMKHWRLPVHDYAAFGDSLNDVEMLENAAVSIAAPAAEAEIVKLADDRTPSIEQGGIAAWLKEQGWIE